MTRYRLLALVCLCAASVAADDQSNTVDVSRDSGGSMLTQLPQTTTIWNDGSSLQRQFIAIHDSRLPVDIVGTPGPTMELSGEDEYRYTTSMQIIPNTQVDAVEVRFVLFDVWGDPMVTLATSRVCDFTGGQYRIEGAWPATEHDCRRLYASICYVSRIRTHDGRIITAAPQPVIAEGQRFDPNFDVDKLTPTFFSNK